MSPGELLLEELQTALNRDAGEQRQIVSIECRPSEYRTSFVIEEVDVLLEDGRELQLLAKNVARSALTDDALHAKPTFLANPMREIDVYRHILEPAGIGAPRYFGAYVDPTSDRYWLIIERIAGTELYQIGETEMWRRVARWLATFHSRFEFELAKAAASTAAPLLNYDRNLFQTWHKRAVEFSNSWPARLRGNVAWLAERYEPVIDRLASLRTTVIHGEFFASNVLVQEKSTGLRVAPVDWEMAAIGPGLIDLAALTAGSWSDGDRRSIASAYYEAQTEHDRADGTFDELTTDLAYCRLHLAIQWLGWSAHWTPPQEHAHDWLGDATRLAEELQL